MSTCGINLKNFGFVYSIKVTDISNGFHWTPVVTNVSGVSWFISVCTGLWDGESAIYVYVKCSPCNKSKESEWSCDVDFSITMNSIKPNQNAYVQSYRNTTLNHDSNNVGGTFITWTDMLPYLRGHLMVLDIELSMSPIRLYQPAQVFPEKSTFRIFVDNISQLGLKFGPKFILGGNSWTVYVTKSGEYLGIFLRDLRDPMIKNWTWHAKCSFKLLTSELFFNPYAPAAVEQKFHYSGHDWGYPEFIRWDILMRPENKFVQNDRAVFEIALEVQAAEPLWNIERESVRIEEEPICWKQHNTHNNDKDTLECPICYESVSDRDPVTTKCGHLFCSACIKQTIKKLKKCPICNVSAKSADLRRIYLTR
ncbi:uncharacterized protein LOC129569731 [Sitodiplosis mosellana]|uniref:uncharacterized protein LOC129569731 n=1 Tax=Sitodiplosis mosellana TaxID=263140 RepID=UPI0024451985|nr:uncharacterized protein LOC129569731 [Sitodiplosis mosellana]